MIFKYYKDTNNHVYAFNADGSQDAFIKSGLVKITFEQANALRSITEPSVPNEVSMAQARQALLQKEYLQHVNDYINGMAGAVGEAARIDWEFRTVVKRNYPLVTLIQAELLLTDTQMDELFILAKTL